MVMVLCPVCNQEVTTITRLNDGKGSRGQQMCYNCHIICFTMEYAEKDADKFKQLLNLSEIIASKKKEIDELIEERQSLISYLSKNVAFMYKE